MDELRLGLAATPQIRVLAIAGSVRTGSYNRALLAAARELAPAGMAIEVRDLAPLPFFDPDSAPDQTPPAVRAFVEATASADALLLATPEYNYGVPAVLTNALDWASQPPGESVLRGKPAAIIGASTGMGGTVRAQLQLRQAFVYTQVHALLQPELFVARAQDKFDRAGRLRDAGTRDRLSHLLECLAEWTERLRTPRRAVTPDAAFVIA